ncbi:ribonuclease H-like domain-containing protein [Mycena galopus ATCC 62051]|nr:ribonuclease H-like domain-containing protein [Mycena galopus ATCC 62051]
MSNLKPPLSLVSRCRPTGTTPPSPPRRARAPMSTSTTSGVPGPAAPKAPQSRLLAALDAMSFPDIVDAPKLRPTPPFFAPAIGIAPIPRAPPLKTKAASVPATARKSSLQRITPKTAIPPPAAAVLEATAEPSTSTPAVDLPVYSYKTLSPAPTMRFARDEADAERWIAELDQKGPLSVDFEWVVVYRKNGTRPISLVQVADAKSIVVIQLRTSTSAMARFPLGLQRLLEDPEVPKAGANILADAKKLFKDYGVMMAGLVELGALARQADPPSLDAKVWGPGRKLVALAKLVERYLQKRLRKEDDVRMSNWEDPALEKNERQIEYAANDAYCGLQVYNALVALAKANDIPLEPLRTATCIHHASLAPPPHSQAPKDVVPNLVLTPDMEAAGVAAQHLRAYRHWALAHRDVDTMCTELAIRGPSLARGTVVSYVVSAVRLWPALSYDLGRLRLLIQMDLKSWERHYEWLAAVGKVA